MTPPLRTTPAPACRRCGAAGQVRHAALADRILAAPGTWSVRACTRCRLTWLDPQPHPDDIGRLYEGAYMTHAASAADAHVSDRTRRYLASHYGYAGPGGSWLPATRLVDDQLGGRVCWLPARPGGTVLDMGCGSGAFLARMRALGWQVAGVEPDPAPMDFSAWFEVFLGGRWHTLDARHNEPRIGRVLMARGRDATDAAISTAFGANTLVKFTVITDEVPDVREGAADQRAPVRRSAA